MLPSPASSPQNVFSNRTNLWQTPTQTKLSFSLPTPPDDKASTRVATNVHPSLKKRKLFHSSDEKSGTRDDTQSSDGENDVEMEDVAIVRARAHRLGPFNMSTRMATGLLGSRRAYLSTRPILQSFVSSHKSDTYKFDSNDVNAYLTPPYACSYSKGAKTGCVPLLAVATEEGSVHVINTSRRKDWDFEPPRTTLQIHNNGIFDVKWNIDDTLLASCSGDHSTRITCPTTQRTIHILRGHTSTVKCIAWDPGHRELLSTGGRDGTICTWDLRVPGGRDDEGHTTSSPVVSIPGAHEDSQVKRTRRGKNVPAPRSVTSLIYPEVGTSGLVSSGSFDGILRYWDLRLPTNARKSKTARSKMPEVAYSSSMDPTTLHGSRRPRGIIRMAEGTGPTAGLVFGLGADSRIHVYDLPSLKPQLKVGYGHESMQTNSFYVGMSLSPCGRWLATGSGAVGSSTKGSVFLFDISNATRPACPLSTQLGVQLQGQQGEVGAIDWAKGMLSSCADDGTVRVWRPDIDTYRMCVEQPEESQWDWSWASTS